MRKYLYFKTGKFQSNQELAEWFYKELLDSGESVGEPLDENYMVVIPVKREGELINIYMGRNDEECAPPLWQVWPELKVGIIKQLFGNYDLEHEECMRKIIERLVSKVEGVSDVEWSDI